VMSLHTLLAAGHDAMTGWTKRRQLSSVASHLFPVASATARWPWCRALLSAAKTPKEVCSYDVFKRCGRLGCHQTASGPTLLNL